MFQALRSRNFRLYFTGQGVSLIGTWMQRMASDWLVYELTHSTLWLGVNAFLSQIPHFLVAPVAGVYVDRWSRHRLLLVTQAMAMVQAAVLAWLVLRGTVGIWAVVAANLVLGIVNAFDTPARQTFVVEMLENRRDLPNAIALNSSLVTATKLVGPTVAGFIISSFGEGACFLFNALSYIAVLAALWVMHIPREVKSTGRNVLAEIREGLGYAYGFRPIRAVICLLALTSLAGVPYMTLLPVYATDILRGGAHTLGFLTAATGVGAMFGTVFLARRKSVLRLGRLIAGSCALFGLSLLAFAYCREQWISLLFLAGSGLGMIVQLASSNTVLQTLVDDEKRGRVMSLYTVAFLGMMPFGSLLAGSIAHRVGAPATVAISGVGCLVGAAWFFRQLPVLNEAVIPVYHRKGIIRDELLEDSGAGGRPKAYIF